MKKLTSLKVFVVLFALLILFALAGCSKKPETGKKTPAKADQLVIVLFDSTKSQSQSQRQDCADYAFTIIEDMPGDSRVLIVPFSNEKGVDELSAIYHEMADDPTKLIPAFDELVQNPSSNKGTNFASPIRLMAIEASRTKLPVVGIIVSDGVFDDEKSTREAIRFLARCANVKLVIAAPVKYQYRSKVERVFKPLGSERWLVRTALDSEGGLDEIRARLKK